MRDGELGPIEDAVGRARERLRADDVVARLWARDHRVWQDDPRDAADRLGWLDGPTDALGNVDLVRRLVEDADADGFTDVVVAGMGGSSLFADVIARTFPAGPLRVHVLDSTDPLAVRRAADLAPLDQLLVIVASKSGTTTETRSHLSWFWEETRGRGEQFVAITDPGTELAELSRTRGFRQVFENRPDLGGRYSALSCFGMVPAELAGVDTVELLGRAREMAEACGPDARGQDNPGADLGAIIVGASLAGRDKLTLLLPDEVSAFADWIEQLVAESTGKHGTGVLPVVHEPVPDDLSRYGDDRLFVCVGRPEDAATIAGAGHPVVDLPAVEPLDLGAEVFRWEVATAVAGALLGVNPFDQPDVAAAKEATSRVLRQGVPDLPEEPLDDLLDEVTAGKYVAILAFVDPHAPMVDELQRVRVALRDRLAVATTLGVGPRYLHSTGQLHKGGPDEGVFVQVVTEDDEELPIPGAGFGFSTLKRAQAAGDLEALRRRGAPVARVALDELLAID